MTKATTRTKVMTTVTTKTSAIIELRKFLYSRVQLKNIEKDCRNTTRGSRNSRRSFLSNQKLPLISGSM
jgi:hypothetical protein